jgi:hypothetical protein
MEVFKGSIEDTNIWFSISSRMGQLGDFAGLPVILLVGPWGQGRIISAVVVGGFGTFSFWTATLQVPVQY